MIYIDLYIYPILIPVYRSIRIKVFIVGYGNLKSKRSIAIKTVQVKALQGARAPSVMVQSPKFLPARSSRLAAFVSVLSQTIPSMYFFAPKFQYIFTKCGKLQHKYFSLE